MSGLKSFCLAAVVVIMLILSCTYSPAQTTTKTFSHIEKMTNWTSCDVCSGAGGAGVTATHWQAQFQTTPSLSGSSSQFYIGGKAYSSALFWKQLGSLPTARHFKYDLQFYLKDATIPQAVEFDMNQSLNGGKYIFGTECDLRGNYKGYWRVWDPTLHWVNTNVPCVGITSAKWHHLTWEFERTTDNRTHFIAVTVDGVRRTVNRYYKPAASSAKELNVAVQTDVNKLGDAFSLWVDNITVTAW